MSDIAAAAENMGIPESLVQRSAEARAKATGASAEEIIAAWAGGGSAPAAAAPSEAPAEAAEAAPAPTPEPAEAAPAELAPVPAAAPAVAAAPAASPPPPPPSMPDPDGAPLLVGREDSGGALIAISVAVVVLGALLAAFFPTQYARSEVNAAVGTQPEYSAAALDGREVFLAEGCAGCHTMLVRSTVTDADLGRVTRPQDIPALAPDTLGMRRIGPDLSDIGARDPGSQLGDVLTFLEDPASVSLDLRHQPYGYLSDRELASLGQFIVETTHP